MTTSSWTRRTLPEPPPTRPDWLGEPTYAEILRAHEQASRALSLAETAERRVQALRVEADMAATHYATKLEELAQPTLDVESA